MALVNALLVRYAGGYHTAEDAASIAAYGRHEGFLSLGALQSTTEVDRVCAAVFTRLANPAETITAGVEPTGVGDVPFDDFDVADWITAPSGAVRVESVTVTEDAEGNPIYAPELETAAQVLEQTIDRWLSRMANGALGGASASASPASPSSELTKRIAATEKPKIPPFSLSGQVAVDDSGEWESDVDFRLTKVVARVRAVGSGPTVVSIRKNGVEVATVTIAAGAKRGVSAALAVDFTAETDVLSFTVTTAGALAEDLVVMPRAA